MTKHQSRLQFSTGIGGLDSMLDGLVPGDNVVLQVAEIEDYLPFVTPFYHNAVNEGKKTIYFRFAGHAPLVEAGSGVEIHHLHPEEGFEKFITETIAIIERGGRGACYVFDCLSELAVDWFSDRMLGNFFMLACPYLYDWETIAYFALLRNRHSPLAVDAIINTAQVYVNIYRHKSDLYVHPLKVENRFSPSMYMLNRWEGDQFNPVLASAVIAAILTETPHPWLDFAINRPGVWRETFAAAREAVEDGKPDTASTGKPNSSDQKAKPLYERLLRMAITRDDKIMDLARRYFTLDELVKILQRMIGTGLIGGKTLGMLLARSILKNDNPEWLEKLEPHDSFFIGSDVFYTYLVQNKCWWLRRRGPDSNLDSLLENARLARQRILKGSFPEDIRHQFMEMLNYFGQSPLIVRSSSLLEDNYGNAFSGKYESVFCTNQGTPAERLEAFMAAVRTVYASTMSNDALTYRNQRGLLNEDEQMALLVQRVSGTVHDQYFFPQLAGVGFSFNPYVWDKSINPRAGMLRLVFGLGTRAVDRTEDDYTRLIALNAPLKQPEQDQSGNRKYTQKRVDILDLMTNRLRSCEIDETLQKIPDNIRELLTEYDYELARLARQQQREVKFPYMLSFKQVLEQSRFTCDMQKMLRTLEDAYENPVDIEFTANFFGKENYLINLVQCRPLQMKVDIEGVSVKLPETIPENAVILESSGPIIGHGVVEILDRIIYVVPEEYARMSSQQRYGVARLIGRITHTAPADGKKIMLIAPGRLGTRSPSLGLPVSFAEINKCAVLCEMAVMHEGLVPDLSLGTHFFNDLVEMEMLCLAVFPNREHNKVNADRLMAADNILAEMLPDAAEWEAAVRVVESTELTSNGKLYLRADPLTQRAICYCGP